MVSVCEIVGKRPKMEDTNMIVPSMEALGLSGDSTSVEKSQSEGSGVRSRPRGQPTLPFGFFGKLRYCNTNVKANHWD